MVQNAIILISKPVTKHLLDLDRRLPNPLSLKLRLSIQI